MSSLKNFLSGVRKTISSVGSFKRFEPAAEEPPIIDDPAWWLTLNRCGDAVLVTDRAGRVSKLNRAAQDLFGLSPTQAVGRPLIEVLPFGPATTQQTKNIISDACREGTAVPSLQGVSFVSGAGPPLAAEISLSSTFDRQGAPRGSLVLVRNVGNPAEAQKPIEHREDELRLITDGVPALIFYIDSEDRFQYANKQYESWLGRNRDDLYGKTIADVLGRPAYDDLREYLDSVRAGHNVHFERWIEYGKRGSFFVQVRYVPHVSPKGQIEGFFALVTNETERKRAEESLEESETRFRAIADAAPVMMWVAGTDMRYTYLNKRCLEFTGQQLKQALGDGWRDRIHADDRDRCATAYRTAFDAREPFELEYRLRRGDGVFRWVWDVAMPRFWSGGDFAGYIGSCNDITDRKQATLELAAAKEDAEEANRVKTQFLANVSHELRTPLNAIIGMTDMALETPLGSTVRDYLLTVVSSAYDLLELVNEILDFSRLEAHAVTIEAQPFSLRDMVDSVIKAFGVRAEQKLLAFVYDLAKDIPDRLVGDRLRLRQVLVNLIGNAIKFTHAGNVNVQVAVESRTDNALVLHFSVRDTGIGISRAKQAEIFEPFVQADASTTRLYGGTGLGLAIARRLVENMGGRLWVDSELGTGSEFHFTSEITVDGREEESDDDPLTVPMRAPTITSESHPNRSSAAAERPHFEGEPLRILFAEDIPANQMVVSSILKKRGHRVDIVGNGRAATERARQGMYDVILMDLQMPVMDGFEATAAIRSEQACGSSVPIVAMTAHTLPEDRLRCMATGMDAYLSKPIDGRELVDVVESLAADRRKLGDFSCETSPEFIVNRSSSMTLEQPSDPAEVILDFAGAMRRLGDDRRLFDDLARFYRADAPGLVENIRTGIERRDMPAVVLAAHSLKGIAAMCGGVRVVKAASHIEELANREDYSSIAAVLPDLDSDMATLEDALEKA